MARKVGKLDGWEVLDFIVGVVKNVSNISLEMLYRGYHFVLLKQV